MGQRRTRPAEADVLELNEMARTFMIGNRHSSAAEKRKK
jgi:hypothetical protein